MNTSPLPASTPVAAQGAAEARALVCGHFGEWLQGRLGREGPVVLVTLPCPALTVRLAGGGDAGVPVGFSQSALAAFRAELGLSDRPWPALAHRIPPGCGAGASTATLVALARGCGYGGDAMALARACLRVEGASDPLMFAHPDRLLWASRAARIMARFDAPPVAEIVGGYWGAPERTKAGDCDFPDIADLLAEWRAAAARGALAALAALASQSAMRCGTHRGAPGTPAEPMADAARATGALGHARAHTGSARALIFAPGSVPDHAEATLREAGLRDVFRFRTGA